MKTGTFAKPPGLTDPVASAVPGPALSRFVKRIFVVESPEGRTHTRLPDLGFSLAIPFRGHHTVEGFSVTPQAVLTGLWNKTRTLAHGPQSAVILASFTETGAAEYFRESADAFFNLAVPLDAIWGRKAELDRTAEDLARADGHATRLRILESYLTARLRAPGGKSDGAMAKAIATLRQPETETRLSRLAQTLGMSQSAFERRFRKAVGASPRTFSSIARFRTVLHLKKSGWDLTTIAHMAGYYDQPHFINDFKRVTGAAPRKFFLEHPDFC